MESERYDISHTASSRLLALHDQEIRAAKLIANPDTYSDFYVDGGPDASFPPFHETVGPSIPWDQLDEKTKARRIAYADRKRFSAAHQMLCGAAFSDHFGDTGGNGGNGAWSEAWVETSTGFFENISAGPI